MITQKSVTDHGLSVVMQEDCALWRGMTGGEICHEDGAATMIAKAEDTPEAPDQPWIPGPYLTITVALDELWIPGPYLTVEPNSPPTHEELAALSEFSRNGRF